MSLVNLVSGGLDSTLISFLAHEQGTRLYPLFVDYGQRAAQLEWETCQKVHQQLGLSSPVRMDLSGFGRVIVSGLTSTAKDVKADAFTPGRNLLFLLVAAAYGYQVGAGTVAIGLLSEQFSLFPDQRRTFVDHAARAIQMALGYEIQITTPLSDFNKPEVLALAKKKGISGTYSCHAGGKLPCGICISCLETAGLDS